MSEYLHIVQEKVAQLTEEFLKENPDRMPRIETSVDGTILLIRVIDAGSAPRDWVLVKNGYYYRPDWKGYTPSLLEAGRYTAAEALLHAEKTEGVTAYGLG